MCHSHQSRSKSHGETISSSSTTSHGSSTTTTDVDLVEREAHSLAAQLTRLADVLTVREFAALRLKIDGTFDHLLFDDGSGRWQRRNP